MKWVLLSLSIASVLGSAAGGYWWYREKGIPLESGVLNNWEWAVRMKPEGYCGYIKRPGFEWQLVGCKDSRSAAKGLALQAIADQTMEAIEGPAPAAEPRATDALARNTLEPLPPLQAITFG